MDVKALLKEIQKNRQLSQDESSLINRAFSFAQRAHQGQKRKSGEPYFNHSYNTALKIAEWKLDSPTIVASLLHDVAEDTQYGITQIKNEFGEEVAFLVDGVTKVGKLKYRGAEAKAENLRKLIIVLSKDIRVILIKLADRLHNIKTLGALPPQKQKRIALETYDIYAPLAYRLGMNNLAGELEDLAFPYLYPEEYKWIIENVKEKYEERQRYLEKVKIVILKKLGEAGIKPTNIDARAKRHSSLYKKLLRQNMNLEQVYDLVALRIIVKTVEDCYATLGIIHQLWPPLPGRIKDYIALPKPNGYKSLHTTVFCLENKPTEFQIRTQEMHDEDESGIAAYWAYSQLKSAKDYLLKQKSVFAEKNELNWVNQLKEWQKGITNPEEFIQSLKTDFFKDRIFAITPKGEVIDLSAGSTSVDFAYAIHTEIGNQCIGAKINGKITPLDYPIQSGDLVEILIQKSKKPSESWLEFVKTNRAKKEIKSALKDSLLRRIKETEFRIVGEDRVGLLKDISSIISKSKINISKIDMLKTAHFPHIKIRCDIKDKEKTERLILKIKNVQGVKEVSCKQI